MCKNDCSTWYHNFPPAKALLPPSHSNLTHQILAIIPPSIIKTLPVQYVLSPPNKKRINWAASSTVPKRCMGAAWTAWALNSAAVAPPWLLRIIGVSMAPLLEC